MFPLLFYIALSHFFLKHSLQFFVLKFPSTLTLFLLLTRLLLLMLQLRLKFCSPIRT